MPNQPRYPMTGVAINPEIKQEVKQAAASRGLTFNQAVEEALIQWLNQLPKS